MGIEDAIKQTTPFLNGKHKAFVNILFTANCLEGRMKDLLKPYGITSQQYNVLRILRGAKSPISTIDIRNRMLDRSCDASRMIDRLLAKCLVSKCAHGADKRLVEIQITDQGRALLDMMDIVVKDFNSNALGLSEEEANQLSFLLDKLRGD